jgi:hypothetical protein
MSDNFLNDENGSLLDALRALRPASPAVTAHDTAFRAGYAAGRRRATLWQATALIAFLLCGASILLPLRPSPPPSVLQQARTTRANPPPDQSFPVSDMADMPDITAIAANLRLRNLILQGPDALPHPPTNTRLRSPASPALDFNLPGLSPWMRMQLGGERNM